ncbi:hypothetical protein lerEdw1_002788 [Lerista edwardsae]|nr:hypothetical protein lerEdw1_002788 [Lerista edwardsae]
MDFDGRLLRQVGGFGRRARLLAAASGLPNVPLALGLAAGLLLAATPQHRCRPDPALLPPALRNASGPELLNASWPRASSCLLYRYPPPGGALAPNGTGPCTRGWEYALPEAGLRSTVVTQWDLVCSNHWKVPLEETTHLLGWLVGFVGFGCLCDRYGRRATFLLGLMLSIPLGAAVALAVNYAMLLLSRLLFGAMLAGAFLSLYVARLELCDPPHRLVMTMGAGACWVAGELLLPGLALLCKEWRLLQGAITLGLALLAACWGLPSLLLESARWLLATRQLEKGRRVLRVLAEANGVHLEEEFYMQEPLLPGEGQRGGWSRGGRNWLLEEGGGRTAAGLPLPARDARAASKGWGSALGLLSRRGGASSQGVRFHPQSWTGCRRGGALPQYESIGKVFRTRVVWKNSLILGFSAFIGSGIRHCFTRNLTPYAPRFYFPYCLLAVSEALALLLLCLTVDRFGRRAALLLSTILTGVSSLLLLALAQYLMAWLILALSVLGILASQAVAALSVLFAGEVLPTVVRGAGLGLLLAASVVGQAAAPLMDLHQSRGFFLHHVVFASFAILSVLSILLLPESSHRPLPDSLREGESQRRPPLFRPRRQRKDHLPLLAPHPPAGPYDPDSYARLVTATKKMLSARPGFGPRRGRGLLLEPEEEQ